MSLWNKVCHRIYQNFFLPSQVNRYKEILAAATAKGYSFETVWSFEEICKHGLPDGNRYLILRRDVDTKAIGVLQNMIRAEQESGAKCSYYFRLSTFIPELVEEILQTGGEVSYHYEEIASFAKKYHIKNKRQIEQSMDLIREQFFENLTDFREWSGQPCKTVASHGDFANRKLGISNTDILSDLAFRRQCEIERETYDIEQVKWITCRIADQGNPVFVEKCLAAINREEPVLYLLTHPRQWGADVLVNLKEDIHRFWDEMRY